MSGVTYYGSVAVFFFFNDTATTEIYTLSLHDALPILMARERAVDTLVSATPMMDNGDGFSGCLIMVMDMTERKDRKSTRLNSSHANISYAVFCLKKKNKNIYNYMPQSSSHPTRYTSTQ